MSERQARTSAALADMDPAARVALEGHRPGAYMRIRLSRVPCEFVQHFDPRCPLLLGGLGQGEEQQGTMRVRFKRHR
jgi:ribosome biogenesis protein BMS1